MRKLTRSATQWMVRRLVLATCIVAGSSVAYACGDSADNAIPRSGDNGCISDGCYDSGGGTSTSPGGDGGASATTDTGPAPLPTNPLEGTSKQATLVVSGFGFTEGPVWVGGKLLFTDTNANNILELTGTTTTVFRNNSGGANGLAADTQGRLYACEGGGKRVVRSAATTGAGVTSIASLFGADGGTPLNAPNDIVVRSDGNVYFTDPNYSGNPNTQDDESVYRISPGGGLSRLPQNFNKPNGIALAPDGNTLYVVDNGASSLLAAPVAANGTVAQNAFQKIADAPGGDGMAVDDRGNLYVTVNGGVDVFDKTGQTKIGTISVAEKPANCAFGGADRRTLYITARTGLYSILLNVPGLP